MQATRAVLSYQHKMWHPLRSLRLGEDVAKALDVKYQGKQQRKHKQTKNQTTMQPPRECKGRVKMACSSDGRSRARWRRREHACRPSEGEGTACCLARRPDAWIQKLLCDRDAMTIITYWCSGRRNWLLLATSLHSPIDRVPKKELQRDSPAIFAPLLPVHGLDVLVLLLCVGRLSLPASFCNHLVFADGHQTTLRNRYVVSWQSRQLPCYRTADFHPPAQARQFRSQSVSE